MNTMNMPEFTAETSLYKTSRHYRARTGTSNAWVDGQGVLPQLSRQLELFQVSGTLRRRGDGDGCACLKVCNGNGGNCTPCTCSPPNCGTC